MPLIIVPSYNEQRNICSVLDDLLTYGFSTVLVVDDGSAYGVYKTVSRYGVGVTEHQVNMGLGATLRTGFEYAITNGFDYVLTFDGDGQMRAEDAVRIFEEAQKGYDFVYGCRDFNIPGVPKVRKFTNLLADLLTALLSGRYVKDTQSGLRCIKVDLLKKFDLKSRGYSISSELIIQSINHGVIPKPVKIDAIYTKESLKKGQKISNSFRVVKELLG